MRPTFEDLKRLWMLAYSRAAFFNVIGFVKAMETAEPSSMQLRALIDATIINYARPFTISQITRDERQIPLKEVSPPAHLASLHVYLLKLRNKVVGHKDATLGETGDRFSNVVVMRREGGGKTTFRTLNLVAFPPKNRKATTELCAHFINYCDERGAPIMKRWDSALASLAPGDYELLVSQPPSDWVKLMDDSGLVNRNDPITPTEL